jgi:GWxTD domain-containing protein
LYRNRSLRAALFIGTLGALTACIGRGAGREDLPAPAPTRPSMDTARTPVEVGALYQEVGMLTQGGALPFTGTVGHLAARTADSTHLLTALSMAANALTFRREGDLYRASYQVTMTLRRAGATIQKVDASEVVRVGSFRETSRTDEAILFQQILTAPPGEYQLEVAVRDEVSGKRAAQTLPVSLPRLDEGTLSSPLPFYEMIPRLGRDSIPRLLLSPRASAVFGRDSTIAIYVESYDVRADAPPVQLSVRVEGRTVWESAVPLERGVSLRHGVVYVPVASVGLGVAEAVLSTTGRSELSRTPIFVAFGDDLPVTTWEDMLNYLQYFSSTARLRALREVDPATRGAAWSAFLAETDPDPSTPDHEGLRDYFERLRQANARFREDVTPGWQTDRGRVYLLLGEPDQIADRFPNDAMQRGRVQVWEYAEYRLSVVFTNTVGANRWRLTPGAEAEVQAAAARRRANR